MDNIEGGFHWITAKNHLTYFPQLDFGCHSKAVQIFNTLKGNMIENQNFTGAEDRLEIGLKPFTFYIFGCGYSGGGGQQQM